MLRALGPEARLAAVLVALAALVAGATALLFLRDVAALDALLAASAWRTAAVAVFSMTIGAVALFVLLRALGERNRDLAAALATTEAERAARRAELDVMQALVDSMADGVIFIDAQDKVALVNQAARALRNLSGGPGREIKDCHPAATHAMLDRVMGWLRAGDPPARPTPSSRRRRGATRRPTPPSAAPAAPTSAR
jgi:PAS domain-containing protein